MLNVLYTSSLVNESDIRSFIKTNKKRAGKFVFESIERERPYLHEDYIILSCKYGDLTVRCCTSYDNWICPNYILSLDKLECNAIFKVLGEKDGIVTIHCECLYQYI